MITKFSLNTRLSAPNTSGRCSVIIRVTSQGQRRDLYTGIVVKPSQWNDNKGRVKQGCKVGGYEYNTLNNTITEFETFVDNYFNDSATRSAVRIPRKGRKMDEASGCHDKPRKGSRQSPCGNAAPPQKGDTRHWQQTRHSTAAAGPRLPAPRSR